jgi:hypothetical protein
MSTSCGGVMACPCVKALIEGGRTRFRPVILTAITTVLGLVPLAIGFNFDFLGLYTRLAPDLFWGGEQAAWWGSMAIAVIVGLTFATILTLVLVPVMYLVVEDISSFFNRHFVAGGRSDEEGTEIFVADTEPRRKRRRRVPVQAFAGIWNRFLGQATE